MSNIFNNDNYTYANYHYRWIDQSCIRKYLYYISVELHTTQSLKILDIGCGTGQFAIYCAQFFPDSIITAIDSSETQIKALLAICEQFSVKNINPIISRFEDFQCKEKFDVIICSEAIHLFDDTSLLIKQMISLLAPNGVIAIRTPSQEQIFSRKAYDYFPNCRFIDISRCKSEYLLRSAFALYGNFNVKTITMDESTFIDTQSYLNGFRLKQYSTLHHLSEEEFETGYLNLAKDCNGKESILNEFYMTMYLFMRRQ